jgi:transcriptional regulator of arginine metabolism
MKRIRQDKILEIIGAKRIATQQELAEEIAKRGIAATQSSISRDIVELGLTKLNGSYAAPQSVLPPDAPVTSIDTAGDNLIVVKTRIGQAQPTALTIDDAGLRSIVGTVAGDDTILIAVRNLADQRSAVKAIVKLFSHDAGAAPQTTRQRTAKPAAPAHRSR